jgi:hypothetical protein
MVSLIVARLQILTRFAFGTLLSLVYVPFPNMVDVILVHLIKNLGTFIEYGLDDEESVCGEVQSDGEDARDVAQEDGSDDGDSGPGPADGFIKACESKSDGRSDE